MDAATLEAHYGDQKWRLNNLYYITDEDGQCVLFQMKEAQEHLFERMHFRNIILKARQLGFTTFIQILMLDAAVLYPNTQCAVIAQSEDAAQKIFQKIKFAFDRLPEVMRKRVQGADFRSNITELHLSNGSSIRVATSVRSGTLNYLHVSEFGATCAHYPHKAREIVTGAFNTLGPGQIAFIESTAEGQEGRFYDMCQAAMSKAARGDKLTQLDWKFHFFPWWEDTKYRLSPNGVTIPPSADKYFAKLATEQGIELTAEQKAWWVKTSETQKEDMGREFPSFPEEAFAQAIEGAYYAEQMAAADRDGRITDVPFDPKFEVETWWDIGRHDYTAIWFVQRTHAGALKVINYLQHNNESLPYYASLLKDLKDQLGYRYSRHIFPHDMDRTDWSTDQDRVTIAKGLGLNPIVIAPKLSVQDGIDASRSMLARCYFDQTKCADGIKSLRQYRKDWNDKLGVWMSKPRHDDSSHGADAFRYGAVAPEPSGKYADENIDFPEWGPV